HKEGYPSLFLTLFFMVVANGAVCYFAPNSQILTWVVAAISIFLLLTILQFFRSPRRNIQQKDAIVLCPADGKVVIVEEAEEPEYFKGKRLQVSIFMSPINVHVNRNPVAGTVLLSAYHPGKYLVAWHPKSSTLNERHTVVLKSQHETILVRQVAGAMAR